MSHNRIDSLRLYADFEEYCKSLGKTVAVIAIELGVDHATLSRLKHGRAIDLRGANLLTLCKAAGLDPMKYYVEREDTP